MKILIRSKLKKEVNDCYLQCRHHIRCPLFSSKIKETQIGLILNCKSQIATVDYSDYLNLFCDFESLSLSIRNKTEVERILRYKTSFASCADCFNKFFFFRRK